MTKKITNNGCERACATCPWLTVNLGKPNPNGFDPKEFAEKNSGHNYFDWYSPENLKRIWKEGVSRGEKFMCHSSDPNASTYGGKDAKTTPKLCVPSVVIPFLHIKRIETLLKVGNTVIEAKKIYRTESKYPMTNAGLAAWTMMIAMGRTEMFGGLPVPTSIDGKLIESISLPWHDSIVNKIQIPTVEKALE